MSIEDKIQILQKKCNSLKNESHLKPVLQQLINDIKHLDNIWNFLLIKSVSYSFFDTVANKISSKRSTVSQFELMDICDRTNWLLSGTLTVEAYNQFAITLEGAPSRAMNLAGKSMLALGSLVLINTILTPTFLGASLAAANLIIGWVLYSNSGATGLAKEAIEVATAYNTEFKPK